MSFPDTDLGGLPPRLRELLSRAYTGTPVNAVAASKAITFSGNSSDAETVTLNGVVFEFNATGTVGAGAITLDVSGGAGLTASAAALAAAVVANPQCLFTATSAGGLCTLTALTAGVVGNAYTLAETCANAAFAGGATLASGGVDGTVGGIGDMRFDGSYVYVATANNTKSGANWKRSALSGY